MASQLNAYLHFNGKARQALEFYETVFGGTLSLNTYASFGAQDVASGDRIMHGQLDTTAGYTIMAADTPAAEDSAMSGFQLSLSGNDAGLLRGYWEKLSAKGSITMPMAKQPWAAEFGMCVDEFGVAWIVNINAPE